MKKLLLFVLWFSFCVAQQEKKDLFDAVQKGDIDTVIQSIRAGVPINERHFIDRFFAHLSALALAAANGDERMVSMLLENGAQVEPKSEYGKTALMYASEGGLVPIMRLLINAGADVNRIYGDDFPHAGSPVLRYAIDSGSIDAVRTLIQAGADVNRYTESGIKITRFWLGSGVRNVTLLEHAIKSGASIEMIEELIKGGADVNKRAMHVGWTPLMVAAYFGRADAVRLLLKHGADSSLKNAQDGGRIALDYAANHEIFSLLAKKESWSSKAWHYLRSKTRL